MAPRSFEADDSLLALGRAVRAIRVDKKLSQEALSTNAEIHPTYISYIEAGRRNLTWTAMKKISGGLGITVAELVLKAEELERTG